MFRHKSLNGSAGMLLLYLADHMRADLTVSVPRTRIAEDLDINVRRVTERMKAAHDAGLLDTIVRGRPGTTAVYKGTFPNSLSAPVRTKEGNVHGAVERTIQRGSYGAPVQPTSSNYSPSETTSPNVLSFTSKTPFSSREENHSSEEEKTSGAATADRETLRGNEVDRETHGAALADRGTPRAQVLDAIQRTAINGGIYTEAGDELILLLEEHYGDEVSGQVANYWTVPRKARDRYEAGVWLTKMLNTLKKEGLIA